MEGPLCYWGGDWWKGTGDSSCRAPGGCSSAHRESHRGDSLLYPTASGVLPAPGGLGGLCTPPVDAMGARPIAGAPPILLKTSSHPEDLAAAPGAPPILLKNSS